MLGQPRGAIVLAVALVTALGASAVAPGHAAGTTHGTPGPIVYAMYGVEGQQLWTSMPGGEPVPVPGTAGARSARWSPDGRVLGYEIWGDGIYLINPDGSGRQRIVTPGPGEILGEPRWSPDGSKIAFYVLATADQAARIDIVDAVEGVRQSIPTELADFSDWLPDGSFLGGAWRTTSAGRNEEIAIQAPDGSLTYLTDTPDSQEGVARLSPDGSKIAFLAYREPAVGPGTYGLGVMDADGGNRVVFDQGTQVFWPAWSPSGMEIAIGPIPTGVRPDGSGAHRLTNGGGSGDGIDWAALPGTADVPMPLAGIRAAALPDPSVHATSAISTSTIWPTRDGYRDTVRIVRRMAEPARVTMTIYAPSGARVRQGVFAFDTGYASYLWNGRSSTGTVLAAGRYRVVMAWHDLAGNPRSTTQYVTLYRGYR